MGEEVEKLIDRLRLYSEHPLLRGYVAGMFRPSLPSYHIVNDIAAAAAEIDSLRASLTRAEAKWSALVENRNAWSEAARAAVAKVEEEFDIEVVSINHHARWVDICDAAEARATRAEAEREERAEEMRAAVLLTLPLMAKTQQNDWSDGFNAALLAAADAVRSIQDDVLSRESGAQDSGPTGTAPPAGGTE